MEERADPSDFGHSPGEDQHLASVFPHGFPRYTRVSNFHEIGVYLANAQYVISLGGHALKDMKYGIIVVPSGEEKLLLASQAEEIITSDFLDDVKWASNKAWKSQENNIEPAADGIEPRVIIATDADEELEFSGASIAKRKRNRGDAGQAIGATSDIEVGDEDAAPARATRRAKTAERHRVSKKDRRIGGGSQA